MKRAITRALGVAFAVAAVTAVGPISPALADPPPFNGKYDIDGGSDEFYWTVTANCPTEGCSASVISNRGWTSVATMAGGRWNFAVTKPDAIVCSNGNFAPIIIAYSIDPATLTGIVTADANGECPGGQVTRTTIQLKKIG